MILHSTLSKVVSQQTKYSLYNFYRNLTSVHKAGELPHVFLFTTPRSGSTWLMELIWSQPGFKAVNEPLDLRVPLVREHLGINTWEELQSNASLPLLQRYIEGYCANKIHTTEPAPWLNRYYKPVTHRIVFKVIHGGENRVNWFRDTFKSKVVFFTRHPIAVALSHRKFPRLEAYINSDFSKHFTSTQLDIAAATIRNGSKLQKGVLDWCFQNALPLRDRQSDWAVLTYEQLVLQPELVIEYLADKLLLPDKKRMLGLLERPSSVTRKSDEETKRLLDGRSNESRCQRLVSKWKDKVSDEEERDAMQILDTFGIDAYSSGSFLPTQDLWVKTGGHQVNRDLHALRHRQARPERKVDYGHQPAGYQRTRAGVDRQQGDNPSR